MKKKIILVVLSLCLFVIEGLNVYGQSSKLRLPNEKISLFTDRNIYVVGESIYFSAIITITDNTSYRSGEKDLLIRLPKNTSSNFSDISYIELITPNGERIAEGKYVIQNLVSSGNLNIPKGIITGNYFLRAYTKYMRNFSPYSYCYIPLKIINPSSKEVLSITNDSSKVSRIEPDQNGITNILTISTDKKEYSKREKVTIKIERVNPNNELANSICISVAPEFSINAKNIYKSTFENIKKYDYYPEIQGISLTGKLVDNNSNKALPLKKINLSIVGNERDFSSATTDSTGRFFFSLPKFIGARDIFLCTEYSKDTKPSILIDNDFCQTKVNLPSPAFKLTVDEKNTAYNLAVNFQLEQHFRKSPNTDTLSKTFKPFYGEPSMVLVFDQYIQLPTIEDYINELLSFLKIKNNHGRKSLKIYSAEPEMQIYEPLILLDLVSIDDPSKILALNPQNISRIELIDVPYIRGNFTYAGIISFFSKKGDYAGIDLPSSGVFFNFNFLTNCADINLNDYSSINKPDTRNTLFWNPNFEFESKKEITFTTSDTPGNYVVVLRGLQSNGEAFYCTSTFSVK
ncbi:MAG: hypothetical protein HXX16_05575 [Bacteroidales bacterium]|nr:hypothetical protein [Bacteroidales bacterium]